MQHNYQQDPNQGSTMSLNRLPSAAPTRSIRAIAVFLLIAAAAPTRAVTMQTVLVGNPGNAPDQNYGAGQFGAVAGAFRMGTFEVTNDQYAEFLNAVADRDTHGLYKTFVQGEPLGISRSGVAGSYVYSVRPNMGNKPANAVNFWDTARFCNWLHNGQPTGAQGPSTTESGAYALNGITNPVNVSVPRSANARWFIPTEDEWYKAAYHQPAVQGGDSDDYWLQATATNQTPTIATANSVGDIDNPGENVANYANGADWNGLDGNLTSVGSGGALSKSYYGTFDQAGNVWEWTESIADLEWRVIRGSSYNRELVELLSAARRSTNFAPANWAATGNVGFRVATVAAIPEPTTIFLALLGITSLALPRRSRRKRGSLVGRQLLRVESLERREMLDAGWAASLGGIGSDRV